MKPTDNPKRKIAEVKRKAAEQERKKEAWKKYESNVRRANSGYSELELDDFSK